MKTTLPALVAVVALASSAVACSAEEATNEVDSNSAISALRSPTGTLTRESAGKAFGGYRQQRAESSKVSAPAKNGGGLGVESIKVLDQASSNAGQGQGGSQACPAGGTMSYQAEQSADGALVKVKATACAFEDGFSFDGNMILLASKKSILGLSAEESSPPAKSGSSSSTGSAPSDDGDYDGAGYGDSMDGSGVSNSESNGMGGGVVALLIAAKGTASYGAKKSPLEFALLTEGQYAFLAVSVADGSIIIGMRDDGKAVVRTKNGTWNCSESGSRWSCTSDKGEKLDATEEAGEVAEGESSGAVPPPSSSSSSDKAPVPPSGEQG